MKLFGKYMKINKKIYTLLAALMLLPIADVYAAGGKITAAQAFYTLAHNNNVQKINELQNRGYSLESTDGRGYNPVCKAIMNQDRNAYRILVSQGANRSPNCLKRIPEDTYRRFFGIRPNQTAVAASEDGTASKLKDIPTWVAASALTAGAVATAYALRGTTGKGGGSPGPGPIPPTPTTCPNGTYNAKTKKCICNEGYQNFGDDSACYLPVANCENQFKSICSACVTGYILSNNKCYAKIANCAVQAADKCSLCETGYGLHGGDGTACYHNIDNCVTQELNMCIQCVAGYDTYGDPSKMQCYKKIEHCLNQVQTACMQCEAGYDTYGDITASHCYASNPCTSYANTVPTIKDGEVECVCNINKGYTGEKENCQLTEEGEYEEGDGNREKWDNVNELYCNSHGKYMGNGICQCYTNRGYAGKNSNCRVEECCTSCVEPTYIQDHQSGLCYINLYCSDHKIQKGNTCVCETGYIAYNDGCYKDLQCEQTSIHTYQQGDKCVCKPNYDENCEQCLEGYSMDSRGNCNAIEPECPENWSGRECNICPVAFLLSSDGLHCGPECAVNRAPRSENDANCSICAAGYDKDRNGLCVVTECSEGREGYIKDDEGNCVCDEANGYAMSRLGICELKGEPKIGISDRNINNGELNLDYDGATDPIFRDVYGMKPVESEDAEGNKIYYDNVYNALTSPSNATAEAENQTATIRINNMNTGANTVYGIYQPNAIYNAAVINRTIKDATATGNIIINDTHTLSYIYGLYNTGETGDEVSKDIYNAFAFGSSEGSAASPTNNQAIGNITVTKDEESKGRIVGIHGVSNIFNAYANTTDGAAANAEAQGSIILTNKGAGEVIGIEGTNNTAKINNALTYMNSAVSQTISEGNIKISGTDDVYGISAKGTVANSETQFSKSYLLQEEFHSTGIIDVTTEKTTSKAYGIYITGENIAADIYNALGYKSTGIITATNNNGGSAYGIWNGIATYIGEDGQKYYNNTYNAFRSSAKYGGDDTTAKGTININIKGEGIGIQKATGSYAAGDIFNAYANSGSDVKLDVIGNINVNDESTNSDITLKGLEGGGATVANAYATGQGQNTATTVLGNINVTASNRKVGGVAAGMYSTEAVEQNAKIINAGLINDKSTVEGNILVQSTGQRPLSTMYGMYVTNYDINGGSSETAQPKDIYNAYYDNPDGVSSGKVTGTIKVYAPNASLGSTAEYYGIFTNGGKAYNVYSTNNAANVKGTIEVDISGSNNTTTAAGMKGVNGAYLYNTGNGANSYISVTTSRGSSNAYGMMGENSYIKNSALIDVKSQRANAYGLYIHNGTIINESTGVLNVNGSTGSYGIYAISDNAMDTLVQNAGTINLTGTSKNVGIFASGSNAKVQNTGRININGTENTDICTNGQCESNVAIMLTDGAQLINNGSITSDSNLDLSAMGGTVSIAEGGSFKAAGFISGDLDVEQDTVMNNFDKEVVLENALDAEDVSQTNVNVNSYLYNTGIKANSAGLYDIVLDMKDFSSVAANSSESAYLEQNYNAEKNAALFNSLKAAPTASAAELVEAKAMGTSFIPNIPEEELKIQRSLNRTMTDELFKDGGDVRKFIGADAMKVGRSDSGTLTGYDINSQSTYALYDKKMNNRYRLGLGMSFTHTDTDYNDDSRRKNFNVQAYVPLTYKLGDRLTAVSMAELGYSDGDYTRKSLNQSFKADTSAITYGLLNEVRYKSNLGPVNVTPFVGLNALGWYQDSISEGKEAEALHISATNVFSLESALGIYVDKDIEFNEDNRLNIALGAAYYHEFADPYDGFDAHHSDSIGKYKLKNKIHSDDRGLISAKLKYDYKAFSIYAELLQYLEEEHPTEFDGGLQYRF